MRIAILESIVMPAGHEVEFDRILVEELKNQLEDEIETKIVGRFEELKKNLPEREEILNEIEDVDEKVLSSFKEYANKATSLDNSYIVVSTPSHIDDFDVLDKILERKISPKYFGMLCSKKKIVDYLNRIYEKYGHDINLDNFYSPIGLQTGGDSPEEVAISIASEILTIHYKKDKINAHLRDMKTK